MRTIRDEGLTPRDWDLEIRNPLAQASTVWATIDSTDLPVAQKILQLRRADPGNILQMTEKLLGTVTKWTILGDNVIGAWGWCGVELADQHQAVNTGAGAFIASAMCYLRVSGTDAGAALDALSPRTVSDLPVNSARFVLFTTTAGTVDEEAVVIRTAPTEFVMSCGGGKQPGWLSRVVDDFNDVSVQPSDVFSFNIKGPRGLAAAQSLVHPDDADVVAALQDFQSCLVRTMVGGDARILKSVLGYEVWAAADVLAAVWQQLVTERPSIVPCGWELLTVYRMECRAIVFGLFPVDMNSGTNLFEVGAGWMLPRIHDHREYIGRTALREARGYKRFWLAGLRAVDAAAAPPLVGREVLAKSSGRFLGYITSAASSPREGRPLAFAHLSPECTVGSEVHVEGTDWLVCSIPFGGGDERATSKAHIARNPPRRGSRLIR